MGWVLEWSASTLADRLVFLAIANHADARGMNAWPSIDKIAEEARVHRTTVFRAIDALEASGELTVLRRPGRSSYYGITQLMGSQDATGEGSQIATGGVASTHHRGSRLLPKPSLTVNEPANRPPIPKAPVAKPDPLDAATRARGAEFIRSLRGGK
jgi:hypothetical protein